MTVKVLTILALGLLLGADSPKSDAKKERKLLEGTWKVIAAERGGKTAENPPDLRMVISGNEFSIKHEEETITAGKLKLNPSRNPKEADLEITQDHHENHVGKSALTIYRLDGDTLKWASSEPGSTDRPKDFTTKEGTKQIVITFKREKP